MEAIVWLWEQLRSFYTENLWVSYLSIFICVSYVYNKVFRVRKLPILKAAIVYVLIAIFSVVLWIFQVDASLPILQSLLAVIAMMAIYRIRLFYLSRTKKQNHPSKEGR